MAMNLSHEKKPQRRLILLVLVLLPFILGLYYGRYGRSNSPEPSIATDVRVSDLDITNFDAHASPNASQLMTRDDYSCTKDQPCQTKACCGGFFGGKKGTCGFGPNFCGKDCVSNCEAKSECGKNADPPGKTCPLNVCCSEFGFCGTSSEFCGKGCQTNCGKVKVPEGKAEGGVLKKVIGYYEAWSARWNCHAFPPSAIPVEGLTHINFAFAGIDPDSFKVTTMDLETPESLFREVADVRTLKSGNLDLQVFASVGGWTFSDNNTKTQPVFGNIAKNEGNRQKFADNVVSFMKQYGFDGVDIDWEYPGAPDRGGHIDDTKNFVALMKTLKATFDKVAKGKYGLTFTVPTSYWYLRWFDLPGMLKHADWVNVMSYDLHGAWDKDNPIGSIVQGHTNLTEIKQAMELLWRNDVQPKQVVLGFGFYGRSFQLEKADCSETGCAFKDAAAPGPCTNGAGTLGYFEIQDIIKDQKPEIIHDKEAAINYFAFTNKDSKKKRSDDGNDFGKRADEKDQWVSFDDKKTMKQKVDWANDLGLGGSMVWSVDQEDETFSALTGLTGQALQNFEDQKKKSQVTDTGHWASLNGQKCKLTDCAKGGALKCDPGWALASNGTKIKDNCGGAGDRIVCCPVDSMPSTCQWRGGESGKSCHGQCHKGESTLFHSRHATVNCHRPGFQDFCCEATTFTDLIDACKWTACKYTSSGKPNKAKASTRCGSDTVKVATKQDPLNCVLSKSWSDYNIDLCCPKGSEFGNCHWVGKGTCDDNECSATDVLVDRDNFGEEGSRCAGGSNGRSKSLCCNTPKDLNPFLPVSLDKLFPTKPPKEDFPQFDLSITGAGSVGGPDDGDANQRAFGFLVIDGPSSAVHNLRKRDGSHWHILSCEPMQASGAILQIICMNNDPRSNCKDIYQAGAEGTIVAMPEDCGPGSYAVVHSILPSFSQELPAHVKRAMPPESIVYDIELSYDFSLVKRDAGDIFIRIDYSNMGGYWENVVKADPNTNVLGRIHKRENTVDKRFWSAKASDWKTNMDYVRNTGIGKPTMKVDDVNALILGVGKNDECQSDADDGFLSVNVKGKLDLRMRFGFTFVGTLAPNFHLEEAYGFVDSSVQHDGTLDFDGRGKVSIHGEGFKQKSILPKPLTAYEFNHPGIVRLAPQLDVLATVIGDGEINGKFSADFVAGNDETFMTFNQPKSLGEIKGGVANLLPDDAFEGELTSEISSKSSRNRKRATKGDTLFAMSLFYNTMMRIDLHNYGTLLDNANLTTSHFVDSYVRLQAGDGGNVEVTQSNPEAAYKYKRVGEVADWGESTDVVTVGAKGKVFTLYNDHKEPAKRDAPKIDDPPIFESKNAIKCSADTESKCLPLSELSKYDEDLDNDPETGQPYNEDEAGAGTQLSKRDGSPRKYTIRFHNGEFTMESLWYPAGRNGDRLLEENSNAGHYGPEDPDDCENTEVTNDANSGGTYVTEHILELNYFPAFIQYAITGQQALPRGQATFRTRLNRVDQQYLNPQSDFFRDYAQWDTEIGADHPSNPAARIWHLFGSLENSHNLVNTDRSLNGIKANIWLGRQPMSDARWRHSRFSQAGTTQSDTDRGRAALTYLNAVFMVISYLNRGDINNYLGDSLTDMTAELQLYSDRHNAMHGTNFDLAALHREYLHEMLIPRMHTVREFLVRRLQHLEATWEDQNRQTPNNPDIEDLLAVIRERLSEVPDLRIDENNMP